MIVGVLASSATDAAAAAETREANAGDEGELGVGGPFGDATSPFGDETSPPPPEIRAKKSPLVHLVRLPGVPMDPGVPSDARRFVSRLTNGVGAESSGGFAAFLDISAPSPTPPRHMESSVSALHLGNARSLVVNVACAVRWHPTENCPAYGTRSIPVDKTRRQSNCPYGNKKKLTGQRVKPVVILSAPADVPERRPVESEG